MMKKSIDGEEVECLEVTVKGQKQVQGNKASKIELFATESDLCPVLALKRARALGAGDQEGPIARWSSGAMITPSFINKFLKETLKDELDWKTSPVTTHSFRAGLPTLLKAIGEEDSMVQDVGRWTSQAFKLYQKASNKSSRDRLTLLRRIGQNM